MKKLIISILCFSLFQVVNAQQAEFSNKYILGGALNFSITNGTAFNVPLSPISIGYINGLGEDVKQTTFRFSPYFGKEVNNNLYVGLQFNFGHRDFEDELNNIFPSTTVERKENQVGFGLFTRHLLDAGSHFSFFVQPHVVYNLLDSEEKVGTNQPVETEVTYFEVGAGLGVLYNISDKVRATLRTGALNYINGEWENKSTDESKDFSIFNTDLNLSSVFIGFEIRL